MAVGVTFAAARALKKSLVDLRLAVKDIPALLVKEPKFKAFSGTTKTPSKEECLVQKKCTDRVRNCMCKIYLHLYLKMLKALRRKR